MNFTPRVDGTDRATIQIAFHIGIHELTNAALHVVSFSDVDVDGLTKAAIERELRMNLHASGDNFAEYGHELAMSEALAQREAIVEKVAELYGLNV